MTRIGLISDTHGLLRPEAVAALHGCQHIVHAGDICDPAILHQLAALAPLTAVRGNNDQGDWAQPLPETAHLPIGSTRLLVLHDLKQLGPADLAPDIGVVVSGHSHKPAITHLDGVVYINPGSAGPRRFRLPISLAVLDVDGDRLSPRIIELLPGA